MSTKIYNGIRFKSKSIHEVTQQLIGIREAAIKLGNERLNDRLPLAIALALHENKGKELHADRYRSERSLFLFTLEMEIQRGMEKSLRRIADPSFLFSVMLFPHPDGTLYGYYLDDNVPGYRDLLYDNDIAEEYHYQNQSDEPEDISEEDWDKRREVWDEILGWDSLNDRGWEFCIVKPRDFDLDREKAIEVLEKITPSNKIYIDTPREWPGKSGKWSHMICESTDVLHRFASNIGVKRHRFENKKGRNQPHYDLKEEELQKALDAGAVTVSSKEIVKLLKEWHA